MMSLFHPMLVSRGHYSSFSYGSLEPAVDMRMQTFGRLTSHRFMNKNQEYLSKALARNIHLVLCKIYIPKNCKCFITSVL